MEKVQGDKTVVLLGVGHTHAHLIKQWAMKPIPDVNLMAVTDQLIATYSGMLPGVLAGDYSNQQMEIDLVQLLSAAKVPWIQEPLLRVDRAAQRLHFASGRSVRYDLLSVGVGSRPPQLPCGPGVDGTPALPVVSIKPMQTFLPRLADALRGLERSTSGDSRLGEPHDSAPSATGPRQIDIVGGGLGSVEVALCIKHFLARCGWPPQRYRLRLLSGSAAPPVGCLASTRRRILRRLNQLNVTVLPSTKLDAVVGDRLQLADGQPLASDLVIFLGAGHAAAATELLDVPLDERGCVLTDHCLQSLVDHRIWAGGDCGTIRDQPLPKAGVFAVRQGPIMWENLQRWSRGDELRPYRPQTDFLKLINVGDGQAIGEWRGFSFEGSWVWRWKDRIDSRFMSMYQQLPETLAQRMGTAPTAQGTRPSSTTASSRQSPTIVRSPPAMRCLGCGSKIASDSLRAVLKTLSQTDSAPEFPVVDWRRLGDDVALISAHVEAPASGSALGPVAGPASGCSTGSVAISVDAFPSPVSDPWLAGRLAVIHALSDLWASGVKPTTVLATVEIPFGPRLIQEDDLAQVMGGLVAELAKHHVRLVGGHTLEGPRLSVALTVLGGLSTKSIPAPKSGWQAGDRLILTKGLGTGVTLAALQLGRCPANLYETALESMLQDNAMGVELLQSFSVHAMTDVTGFGLLGHLREMWADGGLDVQLSADRLRRRAFPGLGPLVERGIRSSMQENNQSFLAGARLDSATGPREWSSDSLLTTLLLDPQTSGGLLLAVPASEAAACQKWIAERHATPAAVIGAVVDPTPAQPNLLTDPVHRHVDFAIADTPQRVWCKILDGDGDSWLNPSTGAESN